MLARRLAGRWLDYGFQLGANVCLIGLCTVPPCDLVKSRVISRDLT